jgi:hypothetical protein
MAVRRIHPPPRRPSHFALTQETDRSEPRAPNSCRVHVAEETQAPWPLSTQPMLAPRKSIAATGLPCGNGFCRGQAPSPVDTKALAFAVNAGSRSNTSRESRKTIERLTRHPQQPPPASELEPITESTAVLRFPHGGVARYGYRGARLWVRCRRRYGTGSPRARRRTARGYGHLRLARRRPRRVAVTSSDTGAWNITPRRSLTIPARRLIHPRRFLTARPRADEETECRAASVQETPVGTPLRTSRTPCTTPRWRGLTDTSTPAHRADNNARIDRVRRNRDLRRPPPVAVTPASSRRGYRLRPQGPVDRQGAPCARQAAAPGDGDSRPKAWMAPSPRPPHCLPGG